MLDTYAFGELLEKNGFRDFSGVPCSYLAPLINYAINQGRFVMANNEGEAVAIASGVSLAGNSSLSERHSSLSDKSGSLSLGGSHYPLGNSFASSLHNPDLPSGISSLRSSISSQILECQEANQDSKLSAKPKIDFEYSESEFARNEQESGAVFCDGFGGCGVRGAGSLLDINDQAECEHSAKSAQKTSQVSISEKHTFGVVLMQNSGLSNALSPLTSLNHTFGIPILGFVSLRGERDERGHNTDEPQHELLGVITDKLLETCEIEYAFLSADFDEAKKQVLYAHKVLESNKSFFFIVRDKTFLKVPLRCNPLQEMGLQNDDYPIAQTQEALPTRLQALEVIQHIAIESKSTLLATTGKCGRELYELGDTPNQLYMVGSMGCVGALGLGIALKNETKVIAIDGDSALLMRLGALSTNAYYAKIRDKGNFCHIVLDNESHDSTGGQFNLSPFVDFCAIARASGYECVYHAHDLSELGEVLRAFIDCERGGAWFVYLRIAKGSKEPLGRPKIIPRQVATRLSRFLAISNGGEE